MRVTNNVYILSGSYYSAVKNKETLGEVYGIRTTEGVVLIDCGKSSTGYAMLKEMLKYYDINEPITHCILTHAHHDHCGSARKLQDLGTKIIVGKEDAAYCLNGGVWGLYTPFEEEQAYPAFIPDILIDKDQLLQINGVNFELIKVPGHTLGSLAIKVIKDGKKILFTGDILQPDGLSLDSVNFGWNGDPNYNREMIIDSMMRLMNVETDIVLPGHGKLCLCNGTSLLHHAAMKAFTTLR